VPTSDPPFSTPNPDPTLLTTQALFREIAHVREMYDVRLDQLDLRLQQRFDAQSKALDAALDSANAKTDTLSAKIDELRSFQFSSLGREAAAPTTASQISAIANRVESLATSRDSTAGKSTGISATGGWIVAGVGLIATIISIVIVLANVLTS
jgi:hypothetical protein